MSEGFSFLQDVEAVSPATAMGLSELEIAGYEGPTGGYVGLFYEPGSDAEFAEATELEAPVSPTDKTLTA